MKKAVGRSAQAIRGFTLIELMIVVAIIAIIAAMAVPAFNGLVAKNKVKAAAEDIYGLVLQGKSEAPIRDLDISVNTKPAATPWCVGISLASSCDCTNTTSCVLPVGATDVVQVVNGDEHPDVTLSAPSAEAGVTFSKIRGTASVYAITVTSGVWELSVDVSADGRVRLCNPNDNNIPGYEGC